MDSICADDLLTNLTQHFNDNGNNTWSFFFFKFSLNSLNNEFSFLSFFMPFIQKKQCFLLHWLAIQSHITIHRDKSNETNCHHLNIWLKNTDKVPSPFWIGELGILYRYKRIQNDSVPFEKIRSKTKNAWTFALKLSIRQRDFSLSMVELMLKHFVVFVDFCFQFLFSSLKCLKI